MNKLIHIFYIVAILVALFFLNRACNQVKEMTALWTGAKSEAEQYKDEAEKFKEKLKEEMNKPPKIVVKTKIIERETEQEVEVPADCQKCFENYKKPLEVCDEDKGICFKSEDVFRDNGHLVFNPRFYDWLSDIYASTCIAEQNAFFRWKVGLGASNHSGLFATMEILNLRRVAKIPVGVLGLTEYDLRDYKDSRIGAGIHWTIWGNVFVMGGYERSIKNQYGVAGIGVWLK